MCQLRQELIELLLPVCKLSSSAVVHTKACHDAVDDKEAVLIASEVCSKGVEELQLVLHWWISISASGIHVQSCMGVLRY